MDDNKNKNTDQPKKTKNGSIDWKQYSADILSLISVKEEAKSLGVRFSSNEPSSSGWLSCHAIDREDNNPSAAICVESTEGCLGSYKDLGGEGATLTFWDLAARRGPHADWEEARRHYGEKVGVPLPATSAGKRRKAKTPESLQQVVDRQLSSLETRENEGLRNVFSDKFASSKGLDAEEVIAAGAFYSEWPATSPHPLNVVGFYAYDPRNWKEPVGVQLYRTDGEEFPEVIIDGKEVLPARKAHLLSKSKDGLIPVGGHEKLATSEKVWLCEGLTDAIALAAYLPDGEVAVTNSSGAGSFRPNLAQAFAGKIVYIVMDADTPGCMGAGKRAKFLAPVAKEVRVIKLPYEVIPKHGKDLRDFFGEGNTYGQLVALAAESPIYQPEPQSTDTGPANLGDSDFEEEDNRLETKELEVDYEAAQFLEENSIRGCQTLKFWRGSFYEWKSRRGKWREIESNGEVQAMLTNYLNERFQNIKRSHTGDVLAQVEAKAIVASSIEMPSWLDCCDGLAELPVHELLVTRGKIIHLPSLVDGKDRWDFDSTPLLFTSSALDFEFPHPDECPKPERWLNFLEDLWGDDLESIKALQLWFGYTLTPDTSMQKFLSLIGPKRSGKGTIARVQRALVGISNVAGPTLSSFSTNFGLQSLLGKSLAIISDARLSGRSDTAIILERILSITGEDAQTVDRKFKTQVTCQLPTRLMILSNELPRMVDSSGAFSSRAIILQTTKSFLDNEDTNLTNDLLEELPGILLWAIQGWAELRDRKKLLQPKSSTALLEEFYDLTSPIGEFVRECCIVGAEHVVPRSELFQHYRTWCDGQGKRYTTDATGLGRDLRAVMPGLGSSQPRINGDRVRCYVGLRLK